MSEIKSYPRIFSTMTDQGWSRLVHRGQEELSDYIRTKSNTTASDLEEVIGEFKRLCDGFEKGSKPNYADVNAVVDEVRAWAGLVAEEIAKQGAQSGENTGLVITRYVLEHVVNVMNRTPEAFLDIPYRLFLSIPKLLDSHAPDTAQILMCCSKPGLVQRRKNRALNHDYGETVIKLQRECKKASERIREIKATDSYSFSVYLRRHDADLEVYRALQKKPAAVELVKALDEKISYTKMFHCDENGIKVRHELGHFVIDMINDAESLHPVVFDERCRKLTEKVEEVDPQTTTSLELIHSLKDLAQKLPGNFYKREILSGKSPVEKFEHSGAVKDYLTGAFDGVKNHPREYAFVCVLDEMREEGGFNDRVYAPLAEMLVAQQNELYEDWLGLAFRFSRYIGWRDGTPDCLQGMEAEGISVKIRFLECLDYSAEHEVHEKDVYERNLKKMLSLAGNAEAKLDILARQKTELEELRAAYE